MAKNDYVISLGSNIQPEENVARALEILSLEHHLLRSSEFQKTAPVGFQDQADFLNGAVYVKSHLEYHDFNAYLKKVENRLKRVKGSIKSGPRTIDLDIIIYNCKVVDTDFFTADYIRKPVQELLEQENIILEKEV